MKSLLVLILFIPLIGMAQQNSGDFDIPGDLISDEELSGNVGTHLLTCGRMSDMFCFGKRPGNFCVVDPARNHTGVCQQLDQPDRRGQVSCRCL